MGGGYAATLRGDGLIVIEPRKFQFKLPLRGFVLLMGAFMLFKGFMLSHLGDAAYQTRLDVLNTGSKFGQAGAFVMGVDPVTRVQARYLQAHGRSARTARCGSGGRHSKW